MTNSTCLSGCYLNNTGTFSTSSNIHQIKYLTIFCTVSIKALPGIINRQQYHASMVLEWVCTRHLVPTRFREIKLLIPWQNRQHWRHAFCITMDTYNDITKTNTLLVYSIRVTFQTSLTRNIFFLLLISLKKKS